MEITAIHNTRLSAVRKVREALLLLSLGSRFRPQHPRKVLNKKEKAEMSTNISASLIGLGVPILFI